MSKHIFLAFINITNLSLRQEHLRISSTEDERFKTWRCSACASMEKIRSTPIASKTVTILREIELEANNERTSESPPIASNTETILREIELQARTKHITRGISLFFFRMKTVFLKAGETSGQGIATVLEAV